MRKRWLWLLLGLIFALRLLFALHLHVNSDEPQHMHVAWSWTQGLLPYRDVFDNHTPLFQFLSAPLLALIGETQNALIWMRIAVIPWYGLALWCTYRIGRVFFGREVGIWAMLLLAIFPDFFLLSVQYRTDDAWAPVWLAMVMVAVEGRPTARRAFVVGLLAGAVVAISLKSLVLLAAIILASVCVLALMHFVHRPLPLAALARTSGALVGGFFILPALIALAFWLAGSWDALIYCVFAHNVLPGFDRWQTHSLRFWIFPASLPVLLLIARYLMRDKIVPERGAKRAFIFMSAGFYIAILVGYWPLTPRQDWLPFAPFAWIYVTAALYALHRRRSARNSWPTFILVLLAIELAVLVVSYRPWQDDTQRYRNFVADILRLTDRSDYVMDAKGESVFRRRPFYYVLEGITLTRMRLGLIDNTIAARLAQTATAVEVPGRLDAQTQAFVDANYLPISADIAVAGQRLSGAQFGDRIVFDVVIATNYSIVSKDGPVAGTLDGVAFVAGQQITVGRHQFVPDAASEPRSISSESTAKDLSPPDRSAPGDGPGALVLIWTKALARGFRARPADEPIKPAKW